MTLDQAKQIVSEAIGFKMGTQLQSDPMLLSEVVLKGIEGVFAGTAEEPDQEAFQQAAMMLQEESTKAARAEGDDFLAGNKSQEGVQITDSGLQYIVTEAGEGDAPKATEQVTVHYEGTLIDGTVFDSSMERGTPAQFGVNQVIPGWVEGLQLMKPGAKFTFFIPQDLAYGERGSGQTIPPFSALIFKVELISIDV